MEIKSKLFIDSSLRAKRSNPAFIDCFGALRLAMTAVVIMFLMVFGLQAATAEVPHLINYQGKLTDSGGAPLNGSYNLTLRIYDAETSGNLLWEEAQAGVIVQKGVFSILLGSVTNLNLAFDIPYFLEIKVGNEVMSPRQRITSAGYAIRAEKAEQANNATTVANVGVSSTPAANKILPLDNNAKLPVAVLKVYDSGWFQATTAHTYNLAHNLGTNKLIVSLYGATDINGTNMFNITQCVRNDGSANHNGSQIQGITTTTLQVQTGNSRLAVRLTADGLDNQYLDTGGYLRVIAFALE